MAETGEQAIPAENRSLLKSLLPYFEKESLAASRALASRRGSFPAFAGSRWDDEGSPPLRNATTTTGPDPDRNGYRIHYLDESLGGDGRRPVVVFLHGSGNGAGTLYRPERSADNVTFKDIAMSNGTHGVRLSKSGSPLANTTFDNVHFKNNTNRGIDIVNLLHVVNLQVLAALVSSGQTLRDFTPRMMEAMIPVYARPGHRPFAKVGPRQMGELWLPVVARKVGDWVDGSRILVSTTKGIEAGTFKLMTEITDLPVAQLADILAVMDEQIRFLFVSRTAGDAFSKLQVLLRLYVRMDVQVQRANQFAIVRGVAPAPAV